MFLVLATNMKLQAKIRLFLFFIQVALKKGKKKRKLNAYPLRL